MTADYLKTLLNYLVSQLWQPKHLKETMHGYFEFSELFRQWRGHAYTRKHFTHYLCSLIYLILTLTLPELKVISLCHQYRARAACTSMQSDQALYWTHNPEVARQTPYPLGHRSPYDITDVGNFCPESIWGRPL